jgi:hypothetical protein
LVIPIVVLLRVIYVLTLKSALPTNPNGLAQALIALG